MLKVINLFEDKYHYQRVKCSRCHSDTSAFKTVYDNQDLAGR